MKKLKKKFKWNISENDMVFKTNKKFQIKTNNYRISPYPVKVAFVFDKEIKSSFGCAFVKKWVDDNDCCLVCSSDLKDKLLLSTLAHEISHVVDYVSNLIGENLTHEARAYLTDDIFSTALEEYELQTNQVIKFTKNELE